MVYWRGKELIFVPFGYGTVIIKDNEKAFGG
jgi:hypothetical protein